MSFINDFTLSSLQCVAVKFNLRGALRDYTCVGLRSIHSRFPVRIT